MSLANVRSALVARYQAGAFGLNTAYENRKESPAAGSPWAAIHFIPAQPFAATQGTQGSDRFDGILQIDLNYPVGTGEGEILAKATEILQQFKAGTQLSYSGQSVTLKASGQSQGNIINSQYRITIDAGWYANVSRA